MFTFEVAFVSLSRNVCTEVSVVCELLSYM